MMHVVRSEWARLMRPGMVLGGGLLLVALGSLATAMAFGLAEAEPTTGPGGATTIAVLEAEDGLVQTMVFSSQVIGAVSLVIFARSIANDHQQGTLKVMLSREPRRFVLFAGKVVALSAFVTASVAVTVVAMLATGSFVAAIRGIDTSAWWTSSGGAETLAGALRLWLATLGWGVFGLMLGTLLRSAGVATGIGIGFFAVGEHMLEMFWGDAAKVLPGLVLAAFTVGGNAALAMGAAAAIAAAYTAAFLFVSATVFWRRDVA